MKKIDDVLALSLFPAAPTKSQRTQLAIVEAAVELFATKGIGEAPYEKTAAEAGVSRTLVIRYFPKREDLLVLSVRYVRASFQRLAVQAMEGAGSPEKTLTAYVASTFRWIEEAPTHARFWSLFYYLCAINP